MSRCCSAEMLAALAVRPDGVYLDATFGVGGYSRAILAAGAGRVLGIDRDPAAVARGRALAAAAGPASPCSRAASATAATLLGGHGVSAARRRVLDLGVSSPQLDDAGARLLVHAPTARSTCACRAEGRRAAELVNGADEATLADILYRYGEERASRRIARAIVERRQRAPIAEHAPSSPRWSPACSAGSSGRIDPATRSFQALRIHVNDELGELERALAAMPTRCWRPAGASWSSPSTRSRTGWSSASLAARSDRQAAAVAPSARPRARRPQRAVPARCPGARPARPGRDRSQSARPLGAAARRPASARRSTGPRGHAMTVKLGLASLSIAVLAACGLFAMKDQVRRLEGELRGLQVALGPRRRSRSTASRPNGRC